MVFLWWKCSFSKLKSRHELLAVTQQSEPKDSAISFLPRVGCLWIRLLGWCFQVLLTFHGWNRRVMADSSMSLAREGEWTQNPLGTPYRRSYPEDSVFDCQWNVVVQTLDYFKNEWETNNDIYFNSFFEQWSLTHYIVWIAIATSFLVLCSSKGADDN